MGLLDHFKVRRAPKRISEPTVSAAVRPPTGFLSWVMLSAPDGRHAPAIMRRLAPTDAMALAGWPVPTYFDWLGLIDGRPSGRATRASVNYDKPLRLQVMETLPVAEQPAQIVGAVALCDQPKDRSDALELAYLEKNPGSPLQGFGTAALALAVLEARRKGLELFLDALIKSDSNLFYRRCGMEEISGTPWPTVTVRMAFTSGPATEAFLARVRERQIIP